MQADRYVKKGLVTLAASLALAAPARADRVLCDGNIFCLAVAVPAFLAMVGVDELTKSSDKRAADYVSKGHTAKLQALLQSRPAWLQNPAITRSLLLNAVAAGNLGATEALVNAGVAPHAENSLALTMAMSPDMYSYLVASGAVPADVDLEKLTYRISEPRLPELLASLLAARPALDPRDPGALRLLRSAAAHRKKEITKMLLQRGVDPNADAMSPLLLAVDVCPSYQGSCEPEIIDIVRDLIASGADVKVVDPESGQSVLEIARKKSYPNIVRLLEDAGA